ncbi:hypothetical protein EV2_015830 [Malus domestica]
MPCIIAAGQYWWHERSNRSYPRDQIQLVPLYRTSAVIGFYKIRVVFIHGLKVLEAIVLPVLSCFRQVDVYLVIEMVSQSKSEGVWILLSEVLSMQSIMDVSSNEDNCISFLSFVDRFVIGRCFYGGSNTLCNKMKLHFLNPLQVVSY